jgi:hypothetical protein
MLLPSMYHWSPAERYESITLSGLVAGSPPVTASTALHRVSVSPDPQVAWTLSGAMDWNSEHEVWDLWLVRLADGDACYVRPGFGPHIGEIQIAGSVPADRVWFVGRRDRDGVPVCGAG